MQKLTYHTSRFSLNSSTIKKPMAWAVASICLITSAIADDLSTGVYTGNFGVGKATIFIEDIVDNAVTGRSLYLHNNRPLKGTINPSNGQWTMVLNEPATAKGDGKFSIVMDSNDTEHWTGNWSAFGNTAIKPKSFEMQKAECGFKSGKGYSPEASERLLTDDDLMLPAYDLDYMRNEIYARHGYSFKTGEWATSFGDTDWYVPCYTDVQDRLSDIEKKNIIQITKATEYARKNPSRFSR